MYRQPSHYKPADPHHHALDTAESVVIRHLDDYKPEFQARQIPYEIRNRSIYCVGKPGNGKSTLLNAIAQQDIENGAGVIVLDPKGSTDEPNMVDTLLDRIPVHRQKDVIYITAQYPIPFDVMSCANPTERQRTEGDIIKMFKTFLGIPLKEGEAQWPQALRWTIRALFDAGDCTFLDIYYFLQDRPTKTKPAGERFTKIFDKVKDPDVRDFWEHFHLDHPGDATVPIKSRMSSFILIPSIKFMFSDPHPEFNLFDVIKERKIVLVDLTGAGDDTADLLGILMVSRVQQAVSRAIRDEEGHIVPCHLFVDEFQNFQTSAFDKMLAEYRSLQLRLTLANQNFSQLDSHLRSAITGCVQTFIVLNIDDKDTSYFKNKMPKEDGELIPHQVLAQLPPYQGLFAIHDQSPVIKQLPLPLEPPTPDQLAFARQVRLSRMEDATRQMAELKHNSSNGSSDDQTSSTPPPHDEGGLTGAREPLRTQDRGRGANYQKTGTKRKRPANYKPELPTPSSRRTPPPDQTTES